MTNPKPLTRDIVTDWLKEVEGSDCTDFLRLCADWLRMEAEIREYERHLKRYQDVSDGG